MNPMFAAALGSILRWGLSILAGYLVSRGIWSDSEAGVYVGAAAMGLTALLWSVYQKYASRVKLVTALAAPGVMSENALEQVVKNEDRRPPVTMDKDRTPYPVGETRRQETPANPSGIRGGGPPTPAEGGYPPPPTDDIGGIIKKGL